MKVNKLILVLALAGVSISTFAGSYNDTAAVPIQDTSAQSPWMVRLRAIDIMPDASSNTISGIGGKVDSISNAVVPELDINYFFTQHISTELILATARHDVTAHNTSLGTVDLGSANILPPTLTAVYHFLPNHMIDPYLGAGINYTHFYNVSSGPVASSINYDDTFGPAFQAGVDVKVSKHFFLNADLKKVYVEPDVTVKAGGQTLKADVKINPWILGLGVGYRF